MLTACALIVSLPAALAVQARMRARPQREPEPICLTHTVRVIPVKESG